MNYSNYQLYKNSTYNWYTWNWKTTDRPYLTRITPTRFFITWTNQQGELDTWPRQANRGWKFDFLSNFQIKYRKQVWFGVLYIKTINRFLPVYTVFAYYTAYFRPTRTEILTFGQTSWLTLEIRLISSNCTWKLCYTTLSSWKSCFSFCLDPIRLL